MSKRVLIVDDDSGFVARIMDSTLTNGKYCFSIADSLKRARYLIKNYKFDIILANVKVPDGNSLDLKKEFMALIASIPFLFMSGIDSDYNYIKNNGEQCYHKYELNNSIYELLESA